MRHLVLALSKLGYHISWSTRNLSQLWPQYRLRVIILGLRGDIARFVLPERRTARSYPRAVKIKMSNYPRKCPLAEAA